MAPEGPVPPKHTRGTLTDTAQGYRPPLPHPISLRPMFVLESVLLLVIFLLLLVKLLAALEERLGGFDGEDVLLREAACRT